MSDSAVKGLIAFIIGVLGAAVVLKIITDASKERKYVCPSCGLTVRKGAIKCSGCRIKLRWV